MAIGTANSSKTNNLKTTFAVLLALLILLNLIGFTIFRNSHTSEELWTQLWNYLSSDLFKLVTISLLLPIIVLILESHFKLVQSLFENHLKRQEAIREEQRALVQKQRDERRAKRWEAIQLTQATLNQYFEFADRVAFYPADNSKDTRSDLLLMLSGVSKLVISGNEVINMWHHRLNLSPDDESLLVYLWHFPLTCGESVARYIFRGAAPAEIEELQESLEIIRDGIRAMAQHPILSFLKLHMQLLELEESDVSTEKHEIEAKLHTKRSALIDMEQFLKRMVSSYAEPLPGICGDAVNSLRNVSIEVEAWLKENPRRPFSEFERSEDFRNLYFSISRKDRFKAGTINYSADFIKHLAEALAYEELYRELNERARNST